MGQERNAIPEIGESSPGMVDAQSPADATNLNFISRISPGQGPQIKANRKYREYCNRKYCCSVQCKASKPGRGYDVS
jgi:hypothetical protein